MGEGTEDLRKVARRLEQAHLTQELVLFAAGIS